MDCTYLEDELFKYKKYLFSFDFKGNEETYQNLNNQQTYYIFYFALKGKKIVFANNYISTKNSKNNTKNYTKYISKLQKIKWSINPKQLTFMDYQSYLNDFYKNSIEEGIKYNLKHNLDILTDEIRIISYILPIEIGNEDTHTNLLKIWNKVKHELKEEAKSFQMSFFSKIINDTNEFFYKYFKEIFAFIFFIYTAYFTFAITDIGIPIQSILGDIKSLLSIFGLIVFFLILIFFALILMLR